MPSLFQANNQPPRSNAHTEQVRTEEKIKKQKHDAREALAKHADEMGFSELWAKLKVAYEGADKNASLLFARDPAGLFKRLVGAGDGLHVRRRGLLKAFRWGDKRQDAKNLLLNAVERQFGSTVRNEVSEKIEKLTSQKAWYGKSYDTLRLSHFEKIAAIIVDARNNELEASRENNEGKFAAIYDDLEKRGTTLKANINRATEKKDQQELQRLRNNEDQLAAEITEVNADYQAWKIAHAEKRIAVSAGLNLMHNLHEVDKSEIPSEREKTLKTQATAQRAAALDGQSRQQVFMHRAVAFDLLMSEATSEEITQAIRNQAIDRESRNIELPLPVYLAAVKEDKNALNACYQQAIELLAECKFNGLTPTNSSMQSLTVESMADVERALGARGVSNPIYLYQLQGALRFQEKVDCSMQDLNSATESARKVMMNPLRGVDSTRSWARDVEALRARLRTERPKEFNAFEEGEAELEQAFTSLRMICKNADYDNRQELVRIYDQLASASNKLLLAGDCFGKAIDDEAGSSATLVNLDGAAFTRLRELQSLVLDQAAVACDMAQTVAKMAGYSALDNEFFTQENVNTFKDRPGLFSPDDMGFTAQFGDIDNDGELQREIHNLRPPEVVYLAGAFDDPQVGLTGAARKAAVIGDDGRDQFMTVSDIDKGLAAPFSPSARENPLTAANMTPRFDDDDDLGSNLTGLIDDDDPTGGLNRHDEPSRTSSFRDDDNRSNLTGLIDDNDATGGLNRHDEPSRTRSLDDDDGVEFISSRNAVSGLGITQGPGLTLAPGMTSLAPDGSAFSGDENALHDVLDDDDRGMLDVTASEMSETDLAAPASRNPDANPAWSKKRTQFAQRRAMTMEAAQKRYLSSVNMLKFYGNYYRQNRQGLTPEDARKALSEIINANEEAIGANASLRAQWSAPNARRNWPQRSANDRSVLEDQMDYFRGINIAARLEWQSLQPARPLEAALISVGPVKMEMPPNMPRPEEILIHDLQPRGNDRDDGAYQVVQNAGFYRSLVGGDNAASPSQKEQQPFQFSNIVTNAQQGREKPDYVSVSETSTRYRPVPPVQDDDGGDDRDKLRAGDIQNLKVDVSDRPKFDDIDDNEGTLVITPFYNPHSDDSDFDASPDSTLQLKAFQNSVINDPDNMLLGDITTSPEALLKMAGVEAEAARPQQPPNTPKMSPQPGRLLRGMTIGDAADLRSKHNTRTEAEARELEKVLADIIRAKKQELGISSSSDSQTETDSGTDVNTDQDLIDQTLEEHGSGRPRSEPDANVKEDEVAEVLQQLMLQLAGSSNILAENTLLGRLGSRQKEFLGQLENDRKATLAQQQRELAIEAAAKNPLMLDALSEADDAEESETESEDDSEFEQAKMRQSLEEQEARNRVVIDKRDLREIKGALQNHVQDEMEKAKDREVAAQQQQLHATIQNMVDMQYDPERVDDPNTLQLQALVDKLRREKPEITTEEMKAIVRETATRVKQALNAEAMRQAESDDEIPLLFPRSDAAAGQKGRRNSARSHSRSRSLSNLQRRMSNRSNKDAPLPFNIPTPASPSELDRDEPPSPTDLRLQGRRSGIFHDPKNDVKDIRRLMTNPTGTQIPARLRYPQNSLAPDDMRRLESVESNATITEGTPVMFFRSPSLSTPELGARRDGSLNLHNVYSIDATPEFQARKESGVDLYDGRNSGSPGVDADRIALNLGGLIDDPAPQGGVTNFNLHSSEDQSTAAQKQDDHMQLAKHQREHFDAKNT